MDNKLILGMNDEQLFFVWLYYPVELLPIKTILSIVNKYNFPRNVVFYKLVQQLLNSGVSRDEIINYLIDNDILTKVDLDKINSVIDECIMEADKYKVRKFDQSIIQEILSMYKIMSSTKKSGTSDEVPHKGYPLPDPEFGRPYLHWETCCYEGCGKTFSNANELVNHLEKLQKMTRGFHLFHESAVLALKLTPEIVMTKGLTKCPSIVCDKKDHKFTPEELCYHLKILGIVPFWKKGDIIQGQGITNNVHSLTEASYNKVYVANECVICMDEPPSSIFLKCFHCLVCINCYKHVNKCPLCNSGNTNIIPF